MSFSESFLNKLSMISLIVTGAIFLYEGIKYITMKQQNPSLPDKLYAAAVLAIILGVAEIAFGIAHFWIIS